MQTEKLYGTALEYAGLTGGETVWDLYCGIGTISLFLAQKAKKVYGVEIVPPAIEDARRNAALNGMENVEFFVGKAEEVLPREYEKNQSMPMSSSSIRRAKAVTASASTRSSGCSQAGSLCQLRFRHIGARCEVSG
mgnify:CR=1 FL=1